MIFPEVKILLYGKDALVKYPYRVFIAGVFVFINGINLRLVLC